MDKNTQISSLTPRLVWKYFEEILQIPRPSGKEDKILKYLIEFAENNKLKYQQDKMGNLVIKKPASKGYENKMPVVLQSHVDMVCEKNNETVHNFENDPIKVHIVENWIKTEGTTLGADNGLGVAAQMAVLSDTGLQHPPIECLFTVEEETGLTGAKNLSENLLEAKTMINLDSESINELCIGCAGGIDTLINVPVNRTKAKENTTAYTIEIKGLRGGHSGVDINKQLGNSIKILGNVLFELFEKYKIDIAEIKGGNLRNAIPRESSAIVLVENEKEEDIKHFIGSIEKGFQQHYRGIENHLEFKLTAIETPEYIIDHNNAYKLVKCIHACPNGIISFSNDIEGLVHTSTNLASIRTTNNNIEVVTSQRSSSEFSKTVIASRIKGLFSMLNANIIHTDGYPGWDPNIESPIVTKAKETFVKVFGNVPEIKAIHAGLECGLILQKYPGLDIVSIGPLIENAHSPDEMLQIDSVENFYSLLTELIKIA